MKYRWDKKYLYWGVTVFLVIVSSLLFYFAIFQMDTLKQNIAKVYGILTPIIFGGIIAYLLTPLCNFLEKNISKLFLKWKKKNISKKGGKILRMGCICLSLILSVWVIYALLAMLIPQILSSIRNIVESFPTYVDNAQVWLTDFLKNSPDLESYATEMFDRYSVKAETWITTELLPQLNNIVKNFSTGLFDAIMFLKNILIGAIISIYIMYNKENFSAKAKRILFSIVKPSFGNNILHNLKFINVVFGGFITGKIIDSIIIGLICYLGTSILKMPYAILVSVIVGVTNIIPFFGPYLGAVPSAFLILLVNPLQCLYFVIFIILLQQLDGNFIGPKILGNSTGLSSFMVIVAILIGGGILGIVGMFIGVPVCAVICALANQSMKKRLEGKLLPVELKSYVDLERIDEQTLKPVFYDKDAVKKSYSDFHNNEEDDLD